MRHSWPVMGTVSTESAVESAGADASRLDEAVEIARACARVPFLVIWTVVCFAARLTVAPVRYGSGGVERKLRALVFATWAKGVCRIVNARVITQGPQPRGAFLLVSNHLSYFDIIVFAKLLGCVFVSMKEVGEWPLIGTLVRGLDTLFIDRTKRRDVTRVNASIVDVVERGEGVIVFPEATTSYGDAVLPFHGALLQPSVELQMPVHYAAVSYRTPQGEDSAAHAICWVDDIPFATQAFRLLRLKQFDAVIRFGERPITAPDRKQLAASLHAAVSKLNDSTEV